MMTDATRFASLVVASTCVVILLSTELKTLAGLLLAEINSIALAAEMIMIGTGRALSFLTNVIASALTT